MGEKKEGDKKAPGMDRERSDGCVNSKEGWRSSEIIQRLLSAVLPLCVCLRERGWEGQREKDAHV